MSDEKEYVTQLDVFTTDSKPYVVTVGGENRPFVLIELAQGEDGADIAVRMTYGGANVDLATELVVNTATMLIGEE